jgi:perosamine synthetase
MCGASERIPHSRPWIVAEDFAAVRSALEEGMIASGQRTRAFESALARYLGTPDAFAVSSGTAALSMGLRALGIGNADEVILPTYLCKSVLNAVIGAGATPVLCDVGEDWNLSLATVQPRVTKRSKAIVIVHMFGISAEMDSIKSLGIPVIQDCCQALGGEWQGRKLGAQDGMSVFSFHATKCLATGEGGLVTASDPELLANLRRVREQSVLCAPLSDFQAALGLSQLNRYQTFLSLRQKIARRYFDELPGSLIEKVRQVEGRSMFFRFPAWLPKPGFEQWAAACARLGVTVRRGVDELLHRLCGLPDSAFPNASNCFLRTLSVPMYPALSSSEQDHVIHALTRVHHENSN